MGVPGLYRYLTEKYPNIVSECVEEIPVVQRTLISSSMGEEIGSSSSSELPNIKKKTVRIVTQPVDASKPNPNGKEFDNLYLDMNGIIHPCCHPEDEEAPKTEEEMYEKIFEYVERIFCAIRPRKVLFLAVDGPAPRAKQNQQRSRRYKTAKDIEDQKMVERQLREELISRGLEPPPEPEVEPYQKPIRIVTKKKTEKIDRKELANLLSEESDIISSDFDESYRRAHEQDQEEEEEFYEIHPAGSKWDSNVITPGTPFMYRLGRALRYFIHMKFSTDDSWKKIKVILSDANVPGEGEHKIMDFIRSQREMPGYNPNTSHVIHGLDADLTMLALATHEPYFYNLREKVIFHSKASQGKGYDVEKKEQGAHLYEYKPLEILHISILREYLELELLSHTQNLTFEYNFERALDDFVFICFFVGNDFLPHLPSLDIREGAIDLLLALYKECLPQLGGYLTERGDVDIPRVQYLLKQVAQYEDQIFENRARKEEQYRKQQEQRKRDQKLQNEPMSEEAKKKLEIVPILKEHRDNFNNFTNPYQDHRKKQHEEHLSALGKRKKDEEENEELEEEAPSEKKVKTSESTNENNETTTSTTETPEPLEKTKMETGQYKDSLKIRLDEAKNVDTVKFPDNVQLGTLGWKERYYKEKMGITVGSEEYEDVSLKYLEGLVWVFRYYYIGCDSWGWFYPYHYAPFASDMAIVDSRKLCTNFEKGEPYRPFSQLLGVLPPRSSHALPAAYSELMLSSESPVKQFYPTDFKIDLNGKTKTWMGICLLPFIDQNELMDAIKTVESKLNNDEIERNSLGNTTIFVHTSNPLQKYMMDCYMGSAATVDFTRASRDLAGTFNEDPFSVAPSDRVKVPWKADLLDDVPETEAISACLELPHFSRDKSFYISKLLPSVTLPPRMLPKILESGGVPTVIGEGDVKTVSFCTPKEMITNIMNGRPRNNYLSVRKQMMDRNQGGGRYNNYNSHYNNNYNDSGYRENFKDRRNQGRGDNRGQGYQNNRNENRGDDTNRDGRNYGRGGYNRGDNRGDYRDSRNDNRGGFRGGDSRSGDYNRDRYGNRNDNRYVTPDRRNDMQGSASNQSPVPTQPSVSPYSQYVQQIPQTNPYQASPYSTNPYVQAQSAQSASPYSVAQPSYQQASPYSTNPYEQPQQPSQQQPQENPYSAVLSTIFGQLNPQNQN